MAVDQHLAPVGYAQTGEQRGDSGLAGSGRADDRDGLPGFDAEVDVPHGPCPAVAEAHAAQFHAAERGTRPDIGDGRRWVRDDPHDPGEGGVAGLHHVEHPHDHVEGAPEADDHEHRARERADRQ